MHPHTHRNGSFLGGNKMKRLKNEPSSTRRWKLSHLLLVIGAVYLMFLAFKFRHFLEIAAMVSGDDSYVGLDSFSMVKDVEDSDLSKSFFSSVYKDTFHRKLEDNRNQNAPMMPSKEPLEEEKRGGTKTIKTNSVSLWSNNRRIYEAKECN
ncbi:hydroxyproline O-galactosyltransferase GALT2 [Populus alba x Populus x berolinensis]|nr:hydroxyproline O-galactosyltransferase GALT2 [Populus alba x Populus x berolinensis]